MRTTLAGTVGTLVIDNPTRRNAMNMKMYEEVPTALGDLVSNEQVRVIVLRGAGDESFGAGSDISEFPERRFGAAAAHYHSVEHAAWQAIASCPLPVIASIHGPCMGGGIAMALHADVRICADDATFAVPPARLGLAYPAEPLARLVDLVGPAQAKLLLYTAEIVDAHAALRIGLVQEVVAKSGLDDRVDDLAARITALAPLSHRATKLSVESLSDPALSSAAAEARATCFASQDFREGVDAFLSKRRPEFEGR